MRFYEYKCENGHIFEKYEPTNAPTTTECKVCGSQTKRIITTLNFGIAKPKPKDYSATERRKRWARGLG